MNRLVAFVVFVVAVSALAGEPILWCDGTWDKDGAPKGKLLSDQSRWFGPKVYTGVTYEWETAPTFPKDVREDGTNVAQRLIGGATCIESDSVGRAGDKPIVAVFDFMRPCSFTEVDFLSPRCTNAAAFVEFSDDKSAWRDRTGIKVISGLTRIHLDAPRKGRYMRMSFQALPSARCDWCKPTKGYTYLDDVLVWGDGEVSKKYPENVSSVPAGDVLTFTNVAKGVVSILPMRIPHLDRKPAGATPAKFVLKVAKNETESRYFAVVNGTKAPVDLAIAAPDFGSGVESEILIGGVLRMTPPKKKLSDTEMIQLHTNDRDGINQGDLENLDVLPFFFPHVVPDENRRRNYLANPRQVASFPEAVPLAPGEGCVVMLRVTTRVEKAWRRKGALVAGAAKLPIELEIVNLALPPQKTWIYAYEPFSQQFPFESATRVRRDAQRYAGMGATTTKWLPEPNSKEEMFFKLAPNANAGVHFEEMNIPAFTTIRKGEYDKVDEAGRKGVVDAAKACVKRAKELGLRGDQFMAFLPDEPGFNNGKSVMQTAKLVKEAVPELKLHCNPLCFRGGEKGFGTSEEIISLFGEEYNKYVDVSCPIGFISSRPELLDALWTKPRFINSQYNHPAGRTGRGMAYDCRKKGFNGFAYYCYYYPNGRDPWDIRTWGVLNYDYQAVFPLENDVALTPLYEYLREGAEDCRLLDALEATGRKDVMEDVLKRSETAWDRTHFQYKLMDDSKEDLLALRETILDLFPITEGAEK